jgi:hypothetical protein
MSKDEMVDTRVIAEEAEEAEDEVTEGVEVEMEVVGGEEVVVDLGIEGCSDHMKSEERGKAARE